MLSTRSLIVFALLAGCPSHTWAQNPSPAERPWRSSIGAGYSVTSGNTDTRNLNLTLKTVRDPKRKAVFSFDGIYVRGSKNHQINADNALANSRILYAFTERTFVYGQTQFLRDTFKQIDAFVAPTVGLGYRLTDSRSGSLSVDASFGGSWERRRDGATATHPVFVIGEKLSRQISKTASMTHAFAATVAANNARTGLYTLSAGVAASLTDRTQVTVELIDTYKTRPPETVVKRNDLSTVFAVGYTF